MIAVPDATSNLEPGKDSSKDFDHLQELSSAGSQVHRPIRPETGDEKIFEARPLLEETILIILRGVSSDNQRVENEGNYAHQPHRTAAAG